MFKIKNKNRYPLPIINENSSYCRWEHRADIHYGAREFMAFVDAVKGVGYIEEMIGGHLERIRDDKLHSALSRFAVDGNLFQPMPMMPMKAVMA